MTAVPSLATQLVHSRGNRDITVLAKCHPEKQTSLHWTVEVLCLIAATYVCIIKLNYVFVWMVFAKSITLVYVVAIVAVVIKIYCVNIDLCT